MSGVPILMYHWFLPSGARSESRSPQLEISPELFERQMAWLQRSGYRTVSLAAALDPAGGANLPAKPVVLTFDDGTLDFVEHARPVLDRFGFKATLFIVTGHVGGTSSWEQDLGEPSRPLMSWDQIRELHGDGHEIGSHGHTHRVWTEMTDDELMQELRQSRAALVEQIGLSPGFVAYPRGRFDERHKRLAADAGFRGACAVLLHWGDLLRSEPFAVRRMTVKGTESMPLFVARLTLSRTIGHGV